MNKRADNHSYAKADLADSKAITRRMVRARRIQAVFTLLMLFVIPLAGAGAGTFLVILITGGLKP